MAMPSAAASKYKQNLSYYNEHEKAGQPERAMIRPAMMAIPSGVDEVGGGAGQPAMAMPSAVVYEKAGQPERAIIRPAMTAIPSGVSEAHEEAGQPKRAIIRPAMTAIPSSVQEVDENEARALLEIVEVRHKPSTVPKPQQLSCKSDSCRPRVLTQRYRIGC
jgi:hypothetical protein